MEIGDLENRILETETNRIVSEVRSKKGSDTRTDKATENMPVGKSANIPLDLLGQCDCDCRTGRMPSRRYTKTKRIETLAINKFKQNGRAISFNDLLSNGLAEHKPQAQGTLKHCLRAGILFTPYNHKPQWYYPTCLNPEISNKNIPVGPIGVGLFRTHLFRDRHKDNHFNPVERLEKQIAELDRKIDQLSYGTGILGNKALAAGGCNGFDDNEVNDNTRRSAN